MKLPATRKIPLDRLSLSPANVRKTAPSASDFAELKASIKAHGLHQNLVVQIEKADDGERGLVVAGGRRLAALQALAEEGELASDAKINCSVTAASTAEEISLVENAVRVAMHPADAFEAYARLIERGATLEDVAARFGVSARHVEQRLRLGGIAPELLQAYRDGELTLEVLKAFTITPDHDRQKAAWAAVEGERRYGGSMMERVVRRQLTEAAISSKSAIGRLVDPDAYDAAGGAVDRDLFGGEDGGEIFFVDCDVARRLAHEKLEEIAAPLRPLWKWVEIRLEHELYQRGWSKLHPQPLQPSPVLADEMATLKAREAELEAIDEDRWTEELGEEHDRIFTRMDEIEGQLEAAAEYTAAQRAASGCIVFASYTGPEVIEGQLSPDDIEALNTANLAAREVDEPGKQHAPGDAEGTTRTTSSVVPGQPIGIERTAAANADEPKPIHSAAVVDDLKAHRVQITAAHIAGDPEGALDLLLWSTVNTVFHRSYRSQAVQITCSPTYAKSSLADLDDTPAAKLLAAHRERLQLEWLTLEDEDAFAGLCALSSEAKHDLLAFCVASCLPAQLANSHNTPLEQVGQRLGIDVAAFWRPTAANYWGRVRKDVAVNVARETISPEWAGNRAGEKKMILANAMEGLFADGKGLGVTDTERADALAWLPEGMAYRHHASTGAAVEDSAETDGADGAATADDHELPAFLVQAAE